MTPFTDSHPLRSSRLRLLILSAFTTVLMIGLLIAGLSHPGVVRAINTVRYVAPSGDCGVATPCYATIQAAVDASVNGDEVRIAAGTYTGVNNQAGLSQLVYIDKSVTLIGGFALADWENPKPKSNLTILNAQGQGRVVTIEGSVSPVIDGLNITGGNATGLGGEMYGRDAGGGIYVKDAAVTISGCSIYSNIGKSVSGGWAYGGGVYLESSPSLVTGNIVYANVASDGTAGLGGGIALFESDAILSNNQIIENTASTASWGEGGGVSIIRGQPTLNHNQVISNTASTAGEGWGGGLYVSQTQAELNGNVVRANVVSENGYGRGGGLYLSEGRSSLNQNIIVENWATRNPAATGEGGGLHMVTHNPNTYPVTLTNNIVADNHATTQGSGIWLLANGDSHISATLKHNTIADNTGSGDGLYLGPHTAAVLTNNIVAGHSDAGISATVASTATLISTLWHGNGQDTGGNGAINSLADVYGAPAFVGDGDYHITASSAAFDAGAATDTTEDVDGDDRPQANAPDIGADEMPAVVVTQGNSIAFAFDDNLSISFPAAAVVSDTTVVYRPLDTVTTTPMGLAFAGYAFNLEALVDSMFEDDFVFAEPVTITITYAEDQLGALDESTLELLFWDGSAWSDAGITIVERDVDNNRLVATLTHLSDFALFAQESSPHKVFLPCVMKSPS